MRYMMSPGRRLAVRTQVREVLNERLDGRASDKKGVYCMKEREMRHCGVAEDRGKRPDLCFEISAVLCLPSVRHRRLHRHPL
jgi:hypothetical protein